MAFSELAKSFTGQRFRFPAKWNCDSAIIPKISDVAHRRRFPNKRNRSPPNGSVFRPIEAFRIQRFRFPAKWNVSRPTGYLIYCEHSHIHLKWRWCYTIKIYLYFESIFAHSIMIRVQKNVISQRRIFLVQKEVDYGENTLTPNQLLI